MKLQPFVERLDGLGFAQLGGVLEWAGLTAVPGRLPAAYVVPNGSTAAANRNDGGVDQRVVVDFSVILVLDGVRRAAGPASDQLHALSTKVWERLLGWKHPDASAPVTAAGDRLLSVDGGSLAWALQFRTAYHLRTR